VLLLARSQIFLELGDQVGILEEARIDELFVLDLHLLQGVRCNKNHLLLHLLDHLVVEVPLLGFWLVG